MDKKFWPKHPEPGFSVKKNNYVIESTIKKYEKERARKQAAFKDQVGERAHAAASYLAGGRGAERDRPIEKYFSKQYLAYLRGEDIRNQLIKEQKMLIKDKKEQYKQKLHQDQLKTAVVQGKGYKIKRTNAEKEEKR